jgi:DNA (cytosine-5)-methyltransferase 1
MKSVELFAGIGGFRVAADSCGIRTVWSNDINSNACKVYRNRFGEAGHVEGDIRHLKNMIPAHDLLTGGFPCQPFSNAGKKEGVRDPRGSLFREIVDVLAEKQPKYFILENVKRLLSMEGGFHFATILSSLAELNYHIEWRLLNAMDLGLPQNRQRLFILGIHEDARPTSLTDERILIRLASAQDLVGKASQHMWEPEDWQRIERHGASFPSWGMARSGRFVATDLDKFSLALPRVPLRDVLQENVSPEFDFTETTLKWIESNTPVNRFIQGVEILSNQGGGARMGYTIFGINGVAPTLTSTTSRHYERYKIGDRFRRLTNIEYARIQGFPEDHCSVVSVYDQYSLYGNAVPPPMAKWVMERLATAGLGAKDIPFQKDLFSYADERATPRDLRS